MNHIPDGTAAVKRTLLISISVITALGMLSGCTMLKNKFGGDHEAYQRSVETPALEIPADLDRPNQSGALLVPAHDSASATVAAPGAGAPRVTPPPAILSPDAAAVASEGLQIADTVASTWTRVGSALEGSEVATIQSRDEASHSYQIVAQAETTKPAGRLKRIASFGKAGDTKVLTPVALRVNVMAAADGSKITIDGAASASSTAAAKKVLDTLRQRLL